MADFKDPKMLARYMRQRGEQLRRAMDKAAEDIAEQAVEQAKTLSAGDISRSELARRNHPYGRGRAPNRKARGKAPLLPINKQSGDLYRKWKKTYRKAGIDSTVQVLNLSPHAIVLAPDGSKKMKPRGFRKALDKKMGPIIRKRLIRAIKTAHKN